MYFRLCQKSLIDRKGSALLAFLAISVSVFVLLSIEHIREQAKTSFGKTVSGVDLIVGARTGNVNLLLYSIFRVGNATNNIRWSSYQDITNDPKVAWSIPISLGDSHRGYRVMGTTLDYFEHFSYGSKKRLVFESGKPFDDVFDVVLGAEVASRLNYSIGDEVVLAHGLGRVSFSLHDDKPFRVSGILKPTGTPVDQTLHVSLAGIEAIHINWQQGVKTPGRTISAGQVRTEDLTPGSITAFMLGLKTKMAIFVVQREINNYPGEPLLAILPGVALAELWQMISVMENTLHLVSILVLTAALLGLSAMLLASIRERQREITIMRTLGASPWFLFLLIQSEALLVTLAAIVFSSLLLFISIVTLSDFLADQYGLYISHNFLTVNNMLLLVIVLVSSGVVGTIPAISAYFAAIRK